MPVSTTFLEMSRDEDHGGGTWGFRSCVWAPTRKENGSDWPFWSKVLLIREGDTVVHLRGKGRKAAFVGYSVASGSGFETDSRPPKPGEWDYSQSFYRADLAQFTAFHKPIDLAGLLLCRAARLSDYFDLNKKRKTAKRNIFFVKQAGRLQCLNGAYLSEIDDELYQALFGAGEEIVTPATGAAVVSVETGVQLAVVLSRIGQARFSAEIKVLYGGKCCFPGCAISDDRFLVGSHIARWSDNEKLRGNLGNGLCLCLIHDKAFETGMFTLDQLHQVFVNPKELQSSSEIAQDLVAAHGKGIRLATIKPIEDALLEHWIRVGLEP